MIYSVAFLSSYLTIDDSKRPLAPIAATDPSPITPRLIQSLHVFHRTNFVSVSSALVQRQQKLNLTFSGSTAFDNGGVVEIVSSRWLPSHIHGFEMHHGANHLDFGVGAECLRSAVMRLRNREINERFIRP